MNPKRIEIISNDPTTDPSSQGMAAHCNNCGCSGNSSSLPIEELIQRFQNRYGSIAVFDNIQITVENKQPVIERLNQILRNSGEILTITEDNSDFVLTMISPVIAVEGRLISIKVYPDEEELFAAMQTGERIPVKPQCC